VVTAVGHLSLKHLPTEAGAACNPLGRAVTSVVMMTFLSEMSLRQ
jgi:hypothetical protein